MAAALLPDVFRDLVEPFLPSSPPRPKGGRPRVSDGAHVTGNWRVCGIRCTLRCSIGWLDVIRSIGRGLNQFRRLRVRYDKRADIHEAFLSLGCALICWRSLQKRWVAG
jgi:hypothetical protein